MGQRLGPGTKRGWTPSPVRAARRIAQMNAARRVREAERVALFWDLVEEQGLTLEELTTRRRRDLPGGDNLGELGKLPVNVSLDAYANAVKPDFGAAWQLRFQFQFLFPK